jgi:hypothetical protein
MALDHNNHALLHELAASQRHIEADLREIKEELKLLREFHIKVERFMAEERGRREEGKKVAQKISFIISLIISSVFAFLNLLLKLFS